MCPGMSTPPRHTRRHHPQQQRQYQTFYHPCGQPHGHARRRAGKNRMRLYLPWKRSRAVISCHYVAGWGRVAQGRKGENLTRLSGSILAKPPEWLAWPPLEAISFTSSLGLHGVRLVSTWDSAGYLTVNGRLTGWQSCQDSCSCSHHGCRRCQT